MRSRSGAAPDRFSCGYYRDSARSISHLSRDLGLLALNEFIFILAELNPEQFAFEVRTSIVRAHDK